MTRNLSITASYDDMMMPLFQKTLEVATTHFAMIKLGGLLPVTVMMTMRVVGDIEEQLVVETSAGKVLGERIVADTGAEVDIWASIPFAELPVGSLR